MEKQFLKQELLFGAAVLFFGVVVFCLTVSFSTLSPNREALLQVGVNLGILMMLMGAYNLCETACNAGRTATDVPDFRCFTSCHSLAVAAIRLHFHEVSHGTRVQIEANHLQVIRHRHALLGTDVHRHVACRALYGCMRNPRIPARTYCHGGKRILGFRRKLPWRPDRIAFLLWNNTICRLCPVCVYLLVYQHIHDFRLLFPLWQHRDT